ncbi:MAG: hypothetical protein HY655_15105 [Acidobacteria bacterium]|nr:hypothetical protein [Acidobacteriota bacterium]
MHALYILLPILCVLAIAYRYYSAFIAARVMMLDDARVTPAHRMYDGHNYYPTSRWVLFGHHFAAITGAGPLIGPLTRGLGIRHRASSALSYPSRTEADRSLALGSGQSMYSLHTLLTPVDERAGFIQTDTEETRQAAIRGTALTKSP